MHKLSHRCLCFLLLVICNCEQFAAAQQLPVPGLAPPTLLKADDAPKWILLRNMQVIQAKTRVAGERITLIMDNGAELSVPTSDIQFQGESIDQIAKFRLAGIDPNSTQSQVEFVEWAIRYDLNGLAKLQLNELIRKYPQSPKLQLLARRIESNELMKQQQAIAATKPAPEFAKTSFVAPTPQGQGKSDSLKKQVRSKNMGRATANPQNAIAAKKLSGSLAQPKTLPSIAISTPSTSTPAGTANQSHSASMPLTAQRKPRGATLDPENSSDPFDPTVFNRMHAKGETEKVPEETAIPIETGRVIRR